MPSSIDLAVGARIRALRLAREMSQAELGHRVGVRFQQIQKYEAGANRITAERLLELAQALGVPIAHFFEGLTAKGVTVPAPQTAHFASERAMAMGQEFLRLREPQQEIVLSLVRSMSEATEDRNGGSHAR